MIQRLSSFKFKDILQYANPRGLLIGSVIVATPLILVFSRLGLSEQDKELNHALSVPRRKPEFITEWEKNYKK